jgi:hypothetical protein
LLQHALDRDADSAATVLRGHIGACVAHTLEYGLLDA